MKPFGACRFGSYSFLTGPPGQRRLEDVCDYLEKTGSHIVLDLETTGLNAILDDILLIAFTFDGLHAYVLDVGSLDLTRFLQVLPTLPVSNHNIDFDYSFLKWKYGVSLQVEWDTMVTYSLATAGITKFIGGASLDTLSRKYLGIPLAKAVRESFSTTEWKTDEAAAYAADDTLATWHLIPITRGILNASGVRHVWDVIERPFITTLVDLHLAGVDFDLQKGLELRDQCRAELEVLRSEIDALTAREKDVVVRCRACRNGTRYKKDGGGPCSECEGTGKKVVRQVVHINPNSYQQLIAFLSEENIDVPKVERNNGSLSPSLDKKARRAIAHPIIPKLNEYQTLSKLVTGFLTRLTTPTDVSPDGHYNHITHRIHTTYTQVYTATGRLSSREPNLQNQKSDPRIRSLFIAPPGHMMVVSDYSQYEVRVLAEVSGDKRLRRFFTHRAELVKALQASLDLLDEVEYSPEIGEAHPEVKDRYIAVQKCDFHNSTAIAIFGLDPDKIDYEDKEWKKKRNIAKSISFAIPYGAGPNRVMQTAEVPLEVAKEAVEVYFKLYPKVRDWLSRMRDGALTPDLTGVAATMGLEGRALSWTETIFGRRRFFLHPTSRGAQRKAEEGEIARQACNFPIQGVNADAIKLALTTLSDRISADDSLRGVATIRLTVHDEIVSTTTEETAKKLARLQTAVMLDVSRRFLRTIPTEVATSINTYWSK